MAEISKIKLPSGNVYELKDAVARQAIASGVKFIMAWDGKSTPVPANIPAGVSVTYEGQTYTGTLSAATAEAGFYLVKANRQGAVMDIYDEYVIVSEDGAKKWEKLGDTHIDLSIFGDLAFKDSVSIVKGDGDNVLGEDTTFEAAPSAVSFDGGSTGEALGVNATFETEVVPSKTKLKATATGAAVSASATDDFIKGISGKKMKLVTAAVHDTPSLDKKYLETTSVPNVTGNDEVTIPNVTGNDEVNVPVVSSNVQRSIPNVTDAGSASDWSFSLGTGDDSETLIIGGGNGEAPTLGTPITATDTAFGTSEKASKITLGTALKASKIALGTALKVATGSLSDSVDGAQVGVGITAGEQKTFATGGLNASGEGAEIMYDLNEPSKASAITAVEMSAQPTITLAAGATGDVEVATGIESAETSINSEDKVTAITDLGTGTAAAQEITVGNNDKIKVAKYADLDVEVE